MSAFRNRLSVMADETERFKDLVARQIGEQLKQGNLDGLIQAHLAAQASLHPGEPARVDADFGGKGTLSGDVVVVPTTANIVVVPNVTVHATVLPTEVPADVIEAIRAALPQLANTMQTSSTEVAMLLLTAFTTLMTMLLTAMAAYQFFHPEAPPPPPSEIFIQTYNVVNPPP